MPRWYENNIKVRRKGQDFDAGIGKNDAGKLKAESSELKDRS